MADGAIQDSAASVPATRAIAGKHPEFEVISIRRHVADGLPLPPPGPTPEGFRSSGVPMFAIFQWAYPLPNQPGLLRGDQIEGDPGWLSVELYDVMAKVGQRDLANWQKPQMRQEMLRAMLQAMLADRCKVVVHYANKEAPVYDLVITKGGLKFKEAETVDTAELRKKHPGGGVMRGTGTMTVRSSDTTHFYAMSMGLLANTILSSLADRPVVDKTGLTGYYDLAFPTSSLQRTPPPGAPGAAQPLDAPPLPLEDESIFAALEKLGLRLQPAKGQIEKLVIDHVERPSEN